MHTAYVYISSNIPISN